MKLENWGVTYHPDVNPYMAPEARPKCLAGTVYGHSVFEDGDDITTSSITKAVVDESGTIHAYTSSGSVYELGEIDPGFAELFDDARQRFIDFWTKRGETVLG